MKKKLIAIFLCVALVAVGIVGATLAYFTDTDNATNTFAVGNVTIDLHESNKESDLAEGEELAVDEDYQDWLKNQVLMPGDNKTNTVSKVVTVENTGKSAAYVRVHIAIPSVLDNAQPDFDASQNLLHFNADDSYLCTGKWNWGKKVVAGRTGVFVGTGDTWNCYTTTIDGISYNVYVVTYESALAANATTEAAMHQVYLYKDVTNEDIAKANKTLGTTWKVLVFAEGCQTDGFTDAFGALNTAFGNPSDTTKAYTDPWGVAHPATPTT